MTFALDTNDNDVVNIKVIGVGGGFVEEVEE